MWGLLEHRIRSLPHVVSCSITPQGLTVLIDTEGDASAVLATVEQVALAAAYPDPVRVIGGKGTPIVPFVTPKRVAVASVFAASIAGAATLMTSVFGTSVGPPRPAQAFEPELRRPGTALAVGPSGQGDPRRIAPVREGAVPARLERIASPVPAGDVSRFDGPRLSDGLTVKPPRQESPEPEGVTDTRRARGPQKDKSCAAPPDRGAPRARSGRHEGNGPRPWSRSVLVPPADCDR